MENWMSKLSITNILAQIVVDSFIKCNLSILRSQYFQHGILATYSIYHIDAPVF